MARNVKGGDRASLRSRCQKNEAARRAAVVTKFGEVAKVSASGKAEFEPWMQRVDVRTYLESDLNPSGVCRPNSARARVVRENLGSAHPSSHPGPLFRKSANSRAGRS